jgi:Fructose-2,6-bisphosphatase
MGCWDRCCGPRHVACRWPRQAACRTCRAVSTCLKTGWKHGWTRRSEPDAAALYPAPWRDDLERLGPLAGPFPRRPDRPGQGPGRDPAPDPGSARPDRIPAPQQPAGPGGADRPHRDASRPGPLQTEAALAEIGLGGWAGETRADLLAQTGAQDGFALYDLAPGGEGLAALHDRCSAFLARLTRPSVLVTHGITSRYAAPDPDRPPAPRSARHRRRAGGCFLR